MLEIAAIKTASQSSEAQSQNGKKPVDSKEGDQSAQEFETEYEATAEDADRASSETERDAAPEEKAIRIVEAKPEQPTSKETPELAEEDVPPELAFGESQQAPVANTEETPNKSPKDPVLVGAKMTPRNVGMDIPATTPQSVDTTAGVEQSSNESRQNTIVKASKENPIGSAAETVIMSKVASGSRDTKIDTAKPTSDAKSLTSGGPTQPEAAAITGASKTLVAQAKPGDVRLARSEEPQLRQAEVQVSTQKPAATSTVSAVKTASAPTPMSVKLDVSREKSEFLPVVSGDAENISVFETRSSSTLQSAPALAQALNRTETPSMIARQMAEALQRGSDRPVEISLSPKELGRVRMSISAAEAGITVNVIAERPETLDLMRRNIDQLSREFQSIGYDSINFAFSQGESNNGFSDTEKSGSDGLVTHLELMEEDEIQIHPENETVVTTGVDIRL